jgi:hypothetical protein
MWRFGSCGPGLRDIEGDEALTEPQCGLYPAPAYGRFAAYDENGNKFDIAGVFAGLK